MASLFNRNARNYYAVQRWFLWAGSALTLLVVLATGIARYFALSSVIQQDEEVFNSDMASDSRGGILSLALIVSACFFIATDSVLMTLVVTLLRKRLPGDELARLRRNETHTLEKEFKDALQLALTSQGFDCHSEQILVAYPSQSKGYYLSVNMYYQSLCSSNKYFVLYVSPSAAREWGGSSRDDDYFSSAKMSFFMHHEARHLVAGHATPWKSIALVTELAQSAFAVQSAMAAVFCVINQVLDLGIIPSTTAVKIFELLAATSLALLMTIKLLHFTERGHIACEHEADRAGIRYAYRELSSRTAEQRRAFFYRRDRSLSSMPKRATCCCCLFSRSRYMLGRELNDAYEEERRLTKRVTPPLLMHEVPLGRGVAETGLIAAPLDLESTRLLRREW